MANYDEEMLFEENEFEFESVKIDSKAPSFNLPFYDPKKDNDGKITLKDLKWKWSVLFFYPADFTFVCPTELEDLEDHHEELKKLGFDVYSVSTDTHFTHKAWHDHSEAIKKVTYTMIGDPTAAVSRIFEVLNEESGLAYRGTFIVNPEGKIVAYEVNDEGIGRDASELVRRAKAAKFVAENPGLVCPAKWKEGEATLKPGLDLVGKI